LNQQRPYKGFPYVVVTVNKRFPHTGIKKKKKHGEMKGEREKNSMRSFDWKP